MKRAFLVAFLVLTGLSMAWANNALPDFLDARYDYAACEVQYAKDWLLMREGCAAAEGLTVFDSSSYVTSLENDLSRLRRAADDGDSFGFRVAAVQLGADMFDLIGAVLVDASEGKTSSFSSCVNDGEDALQSTRDTCRSGAVTKGITAGTAYINNEIVYANQQMSDLRRSGVDTSGMNVIVERFEDLTLDVAGAFNSDNPKDVRKLYLRHSRLVLLFRLEKMLAVIEYAEPVIQAGDNQNKATILAKTGALKSDINSLLTECAYSASIQDSYDYARENINCWDEGVELFEEFNSIKSLIAEGE